MIASHDENLVKMACNEIILCQDCGLQKLESIEQYKLMMEESGT